MPGGRGVSLVAGAFVHREPAKRYPEGTVSPGWHSGRQSTLVVLPRSLAQKFVIAIP
jgi:hypothetical protein